MYGVKVLFEYNLSAAPSSHSAGRHLDENLTSTWSTFAREVLPPRKQQTSKKDI